MVRPSFEPNNGFPKRLGIDRRIANIDATDPINLSQPASIKSNHFLENSGNKQTYKKHRFQYSLKVVWQNTLSDCSIRGSDWARRIDTDGQKWTRFDSGRSIGGIQVQTKSLWYPPALTTQWLDWQGHVGSNKSFEIAKSNITTSCMMDFVLDKTKNK